MKYYNENKNCWILLAFFCCHYDELRLLLKKWWIKASLVKYWICSTRGFKQAELFGKMWTIQILLLNIWNIRLWYLSLHCNDINILNLMLIHENFTMFITYLCLLHFMFEKHSIIILNKYYYCRLIVLIQSFVWIIVLSFT